MKVAAQKQDVKVLLADDESFMREIIVNALTASGYREIRSVFRLAQLEEVMESAYPDLLIINGEMDDGDSVELARQIRLFRIGRNPFIPIIMTSWNPDGPFVRRVVNGGVDVLVTKPLAAGQLFARIDFLINARPPFVATADYIGPDRRRSKREDSFPRFDVPNTLRERISGQIFDAEDLGARISKTFSKIKRQRKLMQEAEIGGLIASVSKAIRDDSAPDKMTGMIDAMAAAAERYAAEVPQNTKAGNPVKTFIETLKGAMSSGTGLSMQDCDRISEIAVEIGINIPSDPGLPAGDDQNDIYIQSVPAASATA